MSGPVEVLCRSKNYLITKKNGVYYINRHAQITSATNGMPQSVQQALVNCQSENQD